jgi:hypothetical protein
MAVLLVLIMVASRGRKMVETKAEMLDQRLAGQLDYWKEDCLATMMVQWWVVRKELLLVLQKAETMAV